MVKAIIFDFDGVITETADIKTEAFRKLFSEYPKKQKEIVRYHLENAGISRYVKFRYIYEKLLKKELSGQEEKELGRRFSEIVLQKILVAPFVNGAKEFINNNRSRYQLFIASGTPEAELDDIVTRRNLKEYFKEIYGSPKEKSNIIEEIRNKHSFDKNSVVYVGDAESDRIAAEKAGINYVERRKDPGNPNGIFWIIKDLSELEEILKRIDSTRR